MGWYLTISVGCCIFKFCVLFISRRNAYFATFLVWVTIILHNLIDWIIMYLSRFLLKKWIDTANMRKKCILCYLSSPGSRVMLWNRYFDALVDIIISHFDGFNLRKVSIYRVFHNEFTTKIWPISSKVTPKNYPFFGSKTSFGFTFLSCIFCYFLLFVIS